ncbi:MAG: DUF4391 domain-containing protein [Gammaproteobacteria bacterium]|nr:DUF4391 domain-containing protein [Gammaproteobacteria bacterium]
MTLYDWPRTTAFGRIVPKVRIYKHSGANATLKGLFIREVDQIVWSHKLAPETVNLAATRQVTEIQVFRITSRSAILSRAVLHTVDRTIPFPLIFEIVYEGRIRLAAAYKRANEADSTRWVVSDYFESDWLPEDTRRTPLPVAIDMEALYEQLLSPLVDAQSARLVLGIAEPPQTPYLPAMPEKAATLTACIARTEAIKARTRDIERIKARLAREKQFNKRVAINAKLRTARQELEQLTTGNSCVAQTNPTQETASSASELAHANNNMTND